MRVAASYVLGLAVSLVTDLPSSAVIVWAMAAVGIVVHLTVRTPVSASESPH